MSRICWDSMLLVYWLEDHPRYSARVTEIRRKMYERGDAFCASVLALGEVLAGIYKRGDDRVASTLQGCFSALGMTLLPFDDAAVDRFARIRAAHRISPADAIHLACASAAGVDLFLTNDHRLHSLVIPGIQFIAGMDIGLF
jgi:predicted nucleic acid-binding protein